VGINTWEEAIVANSRFPALDVHWHSSEFRDVWYKLRQLKKRFAGTMLAAGHDKGWYLRRKDG